MPRRQCENWLKTLGHMSENTESPPHFWLWSGVYTICSALTRGVWVPYGFDPVYPNIYVLFVAPPGKCRKGPPLSMAKRLLTAIQASISVDSSSKESLVKDLSDRISHIGDGEEIEACSPMAIISKELSSLLSVDAKKMIEVLIELYDAHDEWEHKVLSRGSDKIFGPCVSLFAATTPTYLAGNVPYESFGAGFFSRIIMVVGERKPKRVAIPEFTNEQAVMMADLKNDLNLIRQLRGPFIWEPEATEYFTAWYDKLDDKYTEIKDERFHGFIERAHLSVIKTAIALRVAYSDDLRFTVNDVGQAIDLVEDVFTGLPKAFSAMGRAETAIDMDIIQKQIRSVGATTFSDLLNANWMNITEETLLKIMHSLGKMKKISYTWKNGEYLIKWEGE